MTSSRRWIVQDRDGNRIDLTEEQWQHIVEPNNHAEMVDYTEWQELVIDLITSAPANQFLKVSTYTPSFAEAIPGASVERPPVPVAA